MEETVAEINLENLGKIYPDGHGRFRSKPSFDSSSSGTDTVTPVASTHV